MNKERKISLTIRLTKEQRRIVQEEAERIGVSLSAVIQTIVDKYFKN